MAQKALTRIATTCLGMFSLAALAQEPALDGISGEVGFVNNYLHRGVSRSGDDPAMLGLISYTSELGIYGALQGATVDTLVPGTLDDVGSLEIQYTLGYRDRLHADWAWSAAFTYYDYPSAAESGDIGYGEAQLSASYRDWLTGSLAWSDDILDSGEAGVTWELGVDSPTRWGFSVLAGLGYADLGDFYDTDYRYGRIGIGKQWGKLDFSILYSDTDDDASDLFGELAEEEIVVQVSTGF